MWNTTTQKSSKWLPQLGSAVGGMVLTWFALVMLGSAEDDGSAECPPDQWRSVKASAATASVVESAAHTKNRVQDTPLPEIWVRLAGLNVWVAGAREASNERPLALVVMLHGYGKPRDALLALAEREASKLRTTFLFPEAPVALDWRRRAWWKPKGLSDGNGWTRDGEIGLETARNQVIALLGEVERRFDVQSKDIILAGFSQGGTLAFDVSMHYSKQLRGLAVLSGQLRGHEKWSSRLSRLRGMAVFFTHGRRDLVTPFGAANRLRKAVERAGAIMTWVPHNQGHSLTPLAQAQFETFVAAVSHGDLVPVLLEPWPPLNQGRGRTLAGRTRTNRNGFKAGTPSTVGLKTIPAEDSRVEPAAAQKSGGTSERHGRPDLLNPK